MALGVGGDYADRGAGALLDGGIACGAAAPAGEDEPPAVAQDLPHLLDAVGIERVLSHYTGYALTTGGLDSVPAAQSATGPETLASRLGRMSMSVVAIPVDVANLLCGPAPRPGHQDAAVSL